MNSNHQSIEILNIIKKSAKILQYSTLFRLAISTIFNKFAITKVVKSLPGTLRFGVACTMFSVIYKVAHKFIEKFEILKNKRDLRTFVCCALSYVGLMVA